MPPIAIFTFADISVPVHARLRKSPYPLISFEQALQTIKREVKPLESVTLAVRHCFEFAHSGYGCNSAAYRFRLYLADTCLQKTCTARATSQSIQRQT
jgi:hypothetical protein